MRIGELSRELEKAEAQFRGNQHVVPTQQREGTSKTAALADAKITTSTR